MPALNSHDPSSALAFLADAGECGHLIAQKDWSATPLGPAADWPPSLRTAVAVVLRAPVAMTLLWGDAGVMLYNDRYAVIAGQRHPAGLGGKAREIWPEIAAFNDHVLRTVLAGQTLTYSDQNLTVHRNGQPEQAWFTLDYWPVPDESGQPAGVMALVVETTDKVQAQAWLRSESDRMRQMFEQAPGFMAMLRGPAHRFDLVNPAYQQLIGHRNVVGLDVREALPEIAGQGFFELLDHVYASGQAYSGSAVPVTLQQTRGSATEQRFIDFVYQPVRDPAGQVVGVFVQGADVTARIQAEQAAKSSEERNRQILDSAVDYAIFACDLVGTITRWNEGAHRVLGWTEAEMLGQDAARIFTPEDRASGRLQHEMRMALSRGVGNDERWHLRKSGQRFWASGEMTPLRDATGAITGLVKVLRDRTEQHTQALALAQSEQRLRRAQAAGGVGTFSCDIDSDTLHVTPEFCRLFGVPFTETMDAALLQALVLAEDDALASTASSRRERQTPLNTEYRIRRADDGTVRWIARSADHEHNAAGQPVRMVGVVQDVTERKAAQRAIEDSAAQFRVLAQALPNHVWTAPPSGLLDWFNDRTYAYSGALPGQLDGHGWATILHPDDVAAAGQRWAHSLATGQDYETEFRLRDASGAYRWHLARALPLRNGDGAITRWVGTNTDIHERKLAEAQSTLERDRIWALSRELMLVCDFAGTVVAVNPAATRLLGWQEEDMLGRVLSAFVHPDDVAATAAEVGQLSQGLTTLAFENRYRAKDGSYRTLNWTAVPEGQLIHAVGRDVTEQRATEAALRQSQKMEAVGQLTGGIAHDFNNLLQGITGSLELVQKRNAQGRTADADRFVDNAMSSARRAAALTHRLLAFSRRQPLNPRTVEANALIVSMEDLIRRTLGEQIQLATALAAELWLTRCDPNQLESAILNLAINARDAMPSGGRLMIETSNAQLDAAFARQHELRPGRYVCIAVTDTGTGMSAETMARAFEPFFTTKAIGQGTGLGLSMIYGFARQSEGHAKIYSEWGRGSTVKLYLPQHRGAAELDEPLPGLSEAHVARADETVLVVEDEPDVRALIVEVLSELRYQAIEAHDGPSGLAALQTRRRIDLLVTDIGLPGLNGSQLADAGRKLRPGMKVLFMTGYAENAAVASGFLQPGMAMLTKPFTLEDLASRIRAMIEDQPAVGASRSAPA